MGRQRLIFRTQTPLRQSNPGRCVTRDFEIRFLEGPTGLAGRYGASSNSYAKPLRPTSRVRRQTERHARAKTFLTEVGCHCAPRGVDMPRALRASAISLRVTAQPCGPLGSLGAHWARGDPQLASEPARLACALRPAWVLRAPGGRKGSLSFRGDQHAPPQPRQRTGARWRRPHLVPARPRQIGERFNTPAALQVGKGTDDSVSCLPYRGGTIDVVAPLANTLKAVYLKHGVAYRLSRFETGWLSCSTPTWRPMRKRWQFCPRPQWQQAATEISKIAKRINRELVIDIDLWHTQVRSAGLLSSVLNKVSYWHKADLS